MCLPLETTIVITVIRSHISFIVNVFYSSNTVLSSYIAFITTLNKFSTTLKKFLDQWGQQKHHNFNYLDNALCETRALFKKYYSYITSLPNFRYILIFHCQKKLIYRFRFFDFPIFTLNGSTLNIRFGTGIVHQKYGF